MEPIIDPTGPVDPAPSFVRLNAEPEPDEAVAETEDVESSAAQRLRRAGPFVRQVMGAVTLVIVSALLFLHIAENRETNTGIWNRLSADTGVMLTRLAGEPGLLANWAAAPDQQEVTAVFEVASRPRPAGAAVEGEVVDDGAPLDHRTIVLLTSQGEDLVPLGDFARWTDQLPGADTQPDLADLAPGRDASGQATSLPVAIVEEDGVITAYVQYPATDAETPPLYLAMQREAAPRTAWALPLLVLVFAVLSAGLLLLPSIARREALLEQQEAAVAGLIRSKADALRSVSQLDRTKSDFLTAVSHRFRSPLQVVQGIAKLLSDPSRELTPEMTANLAKSLDGNAKRLDDLLQDLLDVDRLTRGAMEPVRRDLDVTSKIREVVTSLDLSHEVNLPDTPVQGSVDPSHLERIVDHLLRNAVDHSPADQAVDITVERLDDGFRFAIEDRGPGIAKQHRLRVFDPLYRIEDGRPDPGVGIGLSLVQRLAAAHGGRAWAEPREGGGSSIWVKIPDEGNDRGVDLWQFTGNAAT